MNDTPRAPTIDGDLLLDVFTHRAIRFTGADMNDDFGDVDRVASLGKRVLEMVVARTLFDKRPMLSASELDIQTDECLSESNLDSWVTMYGFRERVRASPDIRESLKEPSETRLLFHSYIGAVYVQHGLNEVQNWIGKLVDPTYESNESKRSRYQDPPEPIPPADTPPPLPRPQHNYPVPSSPTPSTTVFLPMFNQTCTQRRIVVDWIANSTGPPHAPAWNVQCLVGGLIKGTGHGRSKQLAKEEAAREAYIAMGWASPGF